MSTRFIVVLLLSILRRDVSADDCPCAQTCPCLDASNGQPPCLPYDSRYLATSIDEAMFSFPNLASYDGQPLFEKSGGSGAGGGQASTMSVQTSAASAAMAAPPSGAKSRIAVASEDSVQVGPAAAPPDDASTSPEFVSCKLSIVNGFLENSQDGEKDPLWNTQQQIQKNTGMTQGSCGSQQSSANSKPTTKSPKKFSKQNTQLQKQNEKRAKEIISLLSTVGRKKRAADNSTDTDPGLQLLGTTNQIGCDYKRGATLDSSSKWCGLCNLCWQWRRLPDEYFPNYINEVSCDSSDNGCLAGFGQCRAVARVLNVLRNTGTKDAPNWTQVTIDAIAACECQVQYGNPIHALVSK